LVWEPETHTVGVALAEPVFAEVDELLCVLEVPPLTVGCTLKVGWTLIEGWTMITGAAMAMLLPPRAIRP
jgi:hypothetical protein